MGETKRQVGADEVDELLGEIPNATSGNMALVNGMQYSLSMTPQVHEPKLLEEQSLTSAFAGLNVNDALGSHYPINLSTRQANADSHMSSFGFDGVSAGRIAQENSDLIDPLRLKNHQAGGISMASNGVQVVPNVAVRPVDFPVAGQQQYLMNTQSTMHPYLQLPDLDQSQATWSNVEQQNFYKLCPQSLYYQQLLNQQQFEAPVHQSNVTFSTKRHQLYEPDSEAALVHGYELPSRFLKPPSNLFSSWDARDARAFDRISQQGFGEKYMTRSNGINSLRPPVKFGHVNDIINHISQNGRAGSNNQIYHSLYGPNDTKCFRDDGLDYLRSCEPRLLPLKYNNCSYDASNRAHLMAKDQNGCRLLQKKISEGGPKDVEKVFVDIIDHIVELMTDPFGNYLVQKILEVCNDDQQTRILKVITRNSGDLIHISCDMHGTRVVQKVIETLKTTEQISMVVNSLKPCIVVLMKNTNGNHVAQRCLQHLLPEYSQFLFDAATDYCVELATDRHGCCVLQKCLNFSVGRQKRRLIHQITNNALVLSQDPFGNYVVQYIFELEIPQATSEILDQLEDNYADLSMQKYSSNVVEKCLAYAGEERRGRIIKELIRDPRLGQIMLDPYGNYVIQAALNCSKGALKSSLVEAIEAHVPLLRTSPYGKKVLSCNSLKK